MNKALFVLPLFVLSFFQLYAAHEINVHMGVPPGLNAFALRETFGFFGASQPGEKDKSLMYCQILDTGFTFQPMVSDHAILNNVPNQPNPLYDKSVHQIKTEVKNFAPIIQLNEMQDSLFVVDNLRTDTYQNILSISGIHDATGTATTAGIIAFEPILTGTSRNAVHHYIVAMVKDHTGAIGTSESGLAVVKKHIAEKKEKIKKTDDKKIKKGDQKKNTKEDDYVEITTKIPQLFAIDAGAGTLGGNKALSFDAVRSALSINGGLDQVDPDIFDMHWDWETERLFIACAIKTKNTTRSDQGSRALCVAGLSNDILSVYPIVPSDALASDDSSVLGVFGANKQVSLHKVRVMHPHTRLSYLVVVGDVGKPENTKRSVYAFPLINNTLKKEYKHRTDVLTDAKHTSICCVDQLPEVHYTKDKIQSRALEFNSTNQDVKKLSKYDPAIAVGAGVDLSHDITDITISGDAIYVSIGQEGDQEAGIFYSQAIFDTIGRIVRWTPWKRMFGTIPGVIHMQISQNGSCTMIKKSDKDLNCAKIAWQTEIAAHKTDSKSLSDIVNPLFAHQDGGIYGLFDFSYTMPGISGEQGRNSLLMITGYQKILLLESAADDEYGILRATYSFDTAFESADGSLQKYIPGSTKTIMLTGGSLASLGNIFAACCFTDSRYVWLVVGGDNGVAILSDDAGKGWLLKDGIGKQFKNLSSNMSFKPLGSWKHVRKLIMDGNYLYVLTDKTLERTQLSADIIQANTCSSTLLADASLGGLLDAGISGPCGLLATSHGLWINNSGTDISQTQEKMGWRFISLPNGRWPVYQLFFVSPTGQENGFAYGGQVYALYGSLPDQKTYLECLYVQDVRDSGITDQTIAVLPEYRKTLDQKSLVHFQGFKNRFYTNGTLFLAAELLHLRKSSTANVYSFMPSFVESPRYFSTYVSIGSSLDKSKIVRVILSHSATGNLLIAGDFGLRVYGIAR